VVIGAWHHPDGLKFVVFASSSEFKEHAMAIRAQTVTNVTAQLLHNGVIDPNGSYPS
jgi:hypothetical protein